MPLAPFAPTLDGVEDATFLLPSRVAPFCGVADLEENLVIKREFTKEDDRTVVLPAKPLAPGEVVDSGVVTRPGDAGTENEAAEHGDVGPLVDVLEQKALVLASEVLMDVEAGDNECFLDP